MEFDNSGLSVDAAEVRRRKFQSLAFLEAQRRLTLDYFEEKLSIEKEVIELRSDKEMRLMSAALDEQRTFELQSLEQQFSQQIAQIETSAKEQRLSADVGAHSALADLERSKTDQENSNKMSNNSYFYFTKGNEVIKPNNTHNISTISA